MPAPRPALHGPPRPTACASAVHALACDRLAQHAQVPPEACCRPRQETAPSPGAAGVRPGHPRDGTRSGGGGVRSARRGVPAPGRGCGTGGGPPGCPPARRPLRVGAQRAGCHTLDSLIPPAAPGQEARRRRSQVHLRASSRFGTCRPDPRASRQPRSVARGRALRAEALGDFAVPTKRVGNNVLLPGDELLA